MNTPADTVIAICGGIAAVARMTGRSELRVRRWTYPRARGGTDGLIPADCQVRLLAEARASDIDLRPAHFFPPELTGESQHFEPASDSYQGNEVSHG